jgi:hypothetical protein
MKLYHEFLLQKFRNDKIIVVEGVSVVLMSASVITL